MIKTFLRRWYVINKLHKLKKKHKNVFRYKAPERIKLSFFVLGAELRGLALLDETEASLPVIVKWLFEENTFENALTMVEETISECQHESVNLLESASNRLSFEQEMKLTVRGREQYSWTYLVFGHDYARKIWTGVIVLVVGWILTEQMKSLTEVSRPQFNDGYQLQVEEFRRWVK